MNLLLNLNEGLINSNHFEVKYIEEKRKLVEKALKIILKNDKMFENTKIYQYEGQERTFSIKFIKAGFDLA
jgi:hypothetical protein